MDESSVSNTIPYVDCANPTCTLAHEASAGKIDESILLYLMAR